MKLQNLKLITLFLCVNSPKKWNSSGSVNEPQSGTAEMLLSEIAVLKSRTTEMEKECKLILYAALR
jgi:hypothetical protein